MAKNRIKPYRNRKRYCRKAQVGHAMSVVGQRRENLTTPSPISFKEMLANMLPFMKIGKGRN